MVTNNAINTSYLASTAENKAGVSTSKLVAPSTLVGYTADMVMSGILAWAGAGAYFDDTTLGTFKLLRGGTGYIKGKLITWVAQDYVGMVAGNTYFIYIDSTGTIGAATAHSDALYSDFIPLFECLRDSTPVTNNQLTVREDHPYSFQTGISNYLHDVVGPVIQNINNGANITLNGTQGIQINGSDVMSDHGLDTDITDSGGAAVTWQRKYTTAAGKWARQNATTTFTGFYNLAGTPTALSANRFAVYTLYCSKSNLNSLTPVYIAVLDTAQYVSSGAATTAISNGTTAKATNELAALELAQLGYIIFSQAANAITSVIISKTTLKSGTSTAGTNQASLVNTSTTNFNGWLDATDTNVQSALDALDNTPFTTNSGTASPAAGTLTINGGTSTGGSATNINTIGSGSTVSVCLNNTIDLPTTNTGGTAGVFKLAGVRYLHNYNSGFGISGGSIFLGNSAGNLTTSGTFLTGIGTDCLKASTSGSHNTAVGAIALSKNTTGANNVGIGEGALFKVVSGLDNTGLGFNALYNALGSYNTVIGSLSGNAYTGAEGSNILISNTGLLGESHVIRIGTQGAGNLQQNSCYIAGIASVVNSNKNIVTIDTTTGKLGSQIIGSSTIWSKITVDQTAEIGKGYFCNKAGTLLLTLPAASVVGDVIEVVNINTANGIQWVQAANQQIFIGNSFTTLGIGGSLTSSALGDSIKIVCRTDNLEWQVLSMIGNWTIV